MATSKGRRHIDYDCAHAVLVGVLKPHREKEGQWVLQHRRGTVPVQVHETLLSDLQAGPERYQQPQRLLCWVRWDWEKSRPVLTVVQQLQRKERHQDHYNVRGLLVRVGTDEVVVRITPARVTAEPFEVPVQVTSGWLADLSAGQRVDIICHWQRGSLQARQLYTVRSRETLTLAEAGCGVTRDVAVSEAIATPVPCPAGSA